MKKEYDFSQGERGKFYRPNTKLNLPVYLDEEVLVFVQRIARRRKTDLSSVVNQLLRSDMQVAEVLK
jgi:cytidylate kinase